MANVLIIGASKGVGLETVRAALAAGHQVRALARSAHQIPIEDPALEKLSGDALDPETVERALQGIDAVVQTLGLRAGPSMVLKRTRLFSDSTRVLLPAMAKAGVRRLIAVSGYGAGDSRRRGNPLQSAVFELVLGRAYDDKDLQEEMIRQSGLDWTIARPTLLTSAPGTGRYEVLVEPEDWRCGVVSRSDVADFLVSQVADRSLVGRTPAVTN